MAKKNTHRDLVNSILLIQQRTNIRHSPEYLRAKSKAELLKILAKDFNINTS